MNSDRTRLRKYHRKKMSALRTRNPSYERYLRLYWRYHIRVYGTEQFLWGKPEPARRK